VLAALSAMYPRVMYRRTQLLEQERERERESRRDKHQRIAKKSTQWHQNELRLVDKQLALLKLTLEHAKLTESGRHRLSLLLQHSSNFDKEDEIQLSPGQRP
jgi:hypothetical protein